MGFTRTGPFVFPKNVPVRSWMRNWRTAKSVEMVEVCADNNEYRDGRDVLRQHKQHLVRDRTSDTSGIFSCSEGMAHRARTSPRQHHHTITNTVNNNNSIHNTNTTTTTATSKITTPSQQQQQQQQQSTDNTTTTTTATPSQQPKQQQQQQQHCDLEAQDAVERGKVQVLVLVDRGVLLSVHQPTGVPLRSLRKIRVRPENVRVNVVSNHVLNN